MCIAPVKIVNKRYLPTKKNGFNPPQLTDKRLYEVEVNCGKCIECRKKKAREWSIRLQEELKRDTFINGEKQTPLFITLTFSNEKAKELIEKYNLIELNDIAKKAVRLMMERYRKKNKISFKHWLVTELGEETSRLHLHGIIWLNINKEELTKLWSYGHVDIRPYLSTAGVNYITNYSLKLDAQHAFYKPLICCSKGIGENYITDDVKILKKFNGVNTPDYYTLNNGQKVALPKYYRNKIYSEEERQQLYLLRLQKKEIFVCGVEVDRNDIEKIQKLRKAAQQQEDRWGIEKGKAAKYNKINVNDMFLVEDAKRERQKRVKKTKKLKEYVHGERTFHYNYDNRNITETDDFVFLPNGTFFRKYNNNNLNLDIL